jgi:hypothetical protein
MPILIACTPHVEDCLEGCWEERTITFILPVIRCWDVRSDLLCDHLRVKHVHGQGNEPILLGDREGGADFLLMLRDKDSNSRRCFEEVFVGSESQIALHGEAQLLCAP